MRSCLRNRLRADDGMTVLEVVVAAAILFFVLTAMLGLVGASTSMSVSAKQRSALNNAMESRMEWVRSLPFTDVAITGTGTGKVPASETLVDAQNHFTITLTYTVSNGPSGTKNVTIDGSCAGDNMKTLTMTHVVGLRDRSNSIQYQQSNGQGPKIEFRETASGGQTPDENALLFGDQVWAGGNSSKLYVDAKCDATTGSSIQSVDYTWAASNGGDVCRDSTNAFANLAQWSAPGSIPAGSASFTKSFPWNTMAGSIPDGYVTVTVRATDDQGRTGTKARQFLLDNYPPTRTGIPSVEMTDLSARCTWDAATDGSLPADHYGYVYYQEPSSLVAGVDQWAADGEAFTSATNCTKALEPLSRYWMKVHALSPRNSASDEWAGLSGDYFATDPGAGVPFISSPELMGTNTLTLTPSGKNTAATLTVKLFVTTPTFPCSIDGRVWISENDGAWTEVPRKSFTNPNGWEVQGTTTIGTRTYYIIKHVPWNMRNVPKLGTNLQPISRYKYRVDAVVTPTGWGDKTTQTVTSNVIGYTSSDPVAVTEVEVPSMGWQ